MTPEKKTVQLGVPLKDRDPAELRKVLAHLPEDVGAVFLRLHAYAVKNRLGMTPLSHQTGISTTVFSNVFAGSYAGDYEAVAKRLEVFFFRLEQKELYGGLRQFVPTSLSKTLWAVFEKTRIIRRIQIVQSPEQLGKTTAALAYVAANNSGRTKHISLPGGTKSGCGDFIWALAESLDIPYTIKLREKRLRIKQGLKCCDLVIIDEAHLVSTWTDASARDFWDYLRTDIFDNGERGIVMLATNYSMLAGLQAFRKTSGYNVGQLLGRMRNEIFHIDPAEDIISDDVEALVARYYHPGKATLAYLLDLARRENLGHYGLLSDILNESWTRAKAKRAPLTDTIVNATAGEIIEELKTRKPLYE